MSAMSALRDLQDDSVPRYGELMRRRLAHTLRKRTSVLTLAGSMVAYVSSKRVFSIARRFSIPMSQAIPNGKPGDAARLSLMMGMRAFGRGLTSKFVSCCQPFQPRELTLSRRSPIICTKVDGSSPASGSSIRTTRSISTVRKPARRTHQNSATQKSCSCSRN